MAQGESMIVKGATIFSGGEGVGIGMRASRIEHLWGIEWDDEIAQVARDNGFHSITADVREVNVKKLERPDILHASPVCVNASVAKTNGREAPEDVETAYATCRFIEGLRPSIFTLENVWGYRKFIAFGVILKCLAREGYQVDYWNLNSANYGVPQTRKRLILVARLDSRPRRPEPTHSKNPGTMFGLPKWVGWYSAIEDLIPTLPDSQFAPWQLDRLPTELYDDTLVERQGAFDLHKKVELRQFAKYHPAPTVRASKRADEMASVFLVGGANTSVGQAAPGVGVSEMDEPTRCVASNAKQWKAFIVTQDYGSPNTDDDRKLQILDIDTPAAVVKSSATNGRWRAFVTDGFNAGRKMTVRDCDEPASTVDAMRITKHPRRAWLTNGRVVAITTRCLARFQSFPDSYILPDPNWLTGANGIACRVIGNAVPPLLYQRVIEAQLESS